MADRLGLFRLWVLGGLIVCLVLTWQQVFLSTGQTASLGGVSDGDGLLTVAFLDVGQGDAIYIETFDGIQLLIDGGRDGAVLRELPRLHSPFDRTLHSVLATHPDLDHIGGLIDVLARYEVDNLIMTRNESDTTAGATFAAGAIKEGGLITIAEAGLVMELGASTTLTILSPTGDPTNWESNTSSIVAKLTYGSSDFLLTGDAPIGIENYLVGAYGAVLQSEVLKLGHHGSKTSTALSFLTAVAPEYAVVSTGKDNSYGHPHVEVVKRVEQAGVNLRSTAEDGTIVFKSDGTKVWIEE